MRHRIANGLYRLAGRIDRLSLRPGYGGDDFHIGDKPAEWEAGRDSITVQLHTTDGSRINADFKPGSFTYSALHVGSGPSVTFFLTRRSTRRLIDTLQGVDDLFCKYGEGER